jgi:hypothetical protein
MVVEAAGTVVQAGGTVEVFGTAAAGMAVIGDGTVAAGAVAGEGESLSAWRRRFTSPRPCTIRLRTILRHIMRRTATLIPDIEGPQV